MSLMLNTQDIMVFVRWDVGLVTWKEFKDTSPQLAQEVETCFQRKGLALIGTIRLDGSPRISAVEVFFLPRDLIIGMMRRSTKALDLKRDSRCVLHSTVSDPNGFEPEIKIYGRAISESTFSTYVEAYVKRWKQAPPKTFPAFVYSIDLERVAIIRYDTIVNQMTTKQWSSKSGFKEEIRYYP